MEKNIENLFIKKRVEENKKLFDENERKIIEYNMDVFVKVYKLACLDAKNRKSN